MGVSKLLIICTHVKLTLFLEIGKKWAYKLAKNIEEIYDFHNKYNRYVLEYFLPQKYS